jgi:hypothetical protein
MTGIRFQDVVFLIVFMYSKLLWLLDTVLQLMSGRGSSVSSLEVINAWSSTSVPPNVSVLSLLLLILLLFTEIGLTPGGSSPYTSTHNTKQTIHNYKTKYIQ